MLLTQLRRAAGGRRHFFNRIQLNLFVPNCVFHLCGCFHCYCYSLLSLSFLVWKPLSRPCWHLTGHLWRGSPHAFLTPAAPWQSDFPEWSRLEDTETDFIAQLHFGLTQEPQLCSQLLILVAGRIMGIKGRPCVPLETYKGHSHFLNPQHRSREQVANIYFPPCPHIAWERADATTKPQPHLHWKVKTSLPAKRQIHSVKLKMQN